MIYFIQDSGNTFIKIGYTASAAESRQKAGETWCPFGLVILITMEGDKKTEAELHARFAEARINPDREWFRPIPDLLHFIMAQSEQAAFLRGTSSVHHSLTTPAPDKRSTNNFLRPELRRQELSVLSIQVGLCRRCPELTAARSHPVFGAGPLNPEVCFFGEAPGAVEDKLGDPFVGEGGQLLHRMFAACGIKRDEVYLSNVSKCRTPGFRLPMAREIENCREFLDAQLDLVQPKIICALGACAAQTILNTTQGISKLRGQWYSYKGIPVLCTYHPSRLLPGRGPDIKNEVLEDMNRLLSRMGKRLADFIGC